MTTILARLVAIDEMPVCQKNDSIKQWEFTKGLEKLRKKQTNSETGFFDSLLDDHKSIETEYNALCSHIFYEYTVDRKDQRCEAQLIAALMMAELQEVIYSDLMAVPAKGQKFRADQEIFKKLLKKRDFLFSEKKKETLPDFPIFSKFSPTIRERHAFFNGPKLMILRAKKLFTLMFEEFEQVKAVLDDPFKKPLAWFSWIFFMPRLCINLFMLGKHLIPGPWMSKEEKNIDMYRRFWIQTQRRGFELANDLGWSTSGLLSCFLFVGRLTPIGAYANAVFFAYDVIITVIKAGIEINRLEKLKAAYLEMCVNKDRPVGKLDDSADYLKHLDLRIDIEIAKIDLAVASTLLLLAAVLLGLPCFVMATPALPVLSALFILIITIGTFVMNRKLEERIPTIHLEELLDEEFQDKDEVLMVNTRV